MQNRRFAYCLPAPVSSILMPIKRETALQRGCDYGLHEQYQNERYENGVWLHKTKCIDDIKADMLDTMGKSIFIEQSMVKITLFQRFLRSIVRIFAPLL